MTCDSVLETVTQPLFILFAISGWSQLVVLRTVDQIVRVGDFRETFRADPK